MVTYKERKEKQQNFVLIKDSAPLGTLGNLKKITEFTNEQEFPSYWTLVRKEDNPIIFKEYQIYKVKHH